MKGIRQNSYKRITSSHQMRLVYHYILIDQLAKSDQLDVLKWEVEPGNLAETIVNNSRLTIDYLGFGSRNDLLIDLSASITQM